MLDLQGTWKQLVADLERDFTELRVEAALGKAELRDLLAKAEEQIHALKQKARGSKDSKAVRDVRALLAKVRRGARRQMRAIHHLHDTDSDAL